MSRDARRVDPRAAQKPAPTGRLRIDRQAGISAGTRNHAASTDGPRYREEALSGFLGSVVALVDLDGDMLSAHDRVVLAAARDLADQQASRLLLVVFGRLRTDLSASGVDGVVAFEAAADWLGAMRARAVHAILDATRSSHLVAPDSYDPGGDAARRLAATRNDRPAFGVVAIAGGQVTCQTADPAREATRPLPPVVMVAPGYPARLQRHPNPPSRVPACSVAPEQALEDLGITRSAPMDTPISEAEFILAGGAGVTDWPMFHRVAALLQASPAASRVVVDAGTMNRDRQVGASGTAVRARLYLAMGISGAVQHVEGIARCQYVVSVNQDETCPMTARADVSFVNDCHAVMRALVDALEHTPP
jgi:electron transfer flavoprotein alpha subunit